MTQPRLVPPGFPDVVKTDEDRARFTRLYDDLVRVVGLPEGEALLHAANQFHLGFDVRGALERRKRRKRVVTTSPEELRAMAMDDEAGPLRLDPPGT